jgi:hypothetical protein
MLTKNNAAEQDPILLHATERNEHCPRAPKAALTRFANSSSSAHARRWLSRGGHAPPCSSSESSANSAAAASKSELARVRLIREHAVQRHEQRGRVRRARAAVQRAVHVQ